jgi:hypothetical protein
MKYLTVTMAICIITVTLNTASAAGKDISDLEKLISSYEDTRMNYAILDFKL